MTQLNNENVQLLQAIATGSIQFCTGERGGPLAETGLIVANPNVAGPNPGEVQVSITPSGQQYLSQLNAAPQNAPVGPVSGTSMSSPGPAPAVPAASSRPKAVISEIATGIGIPASTRGNAGNLTPRESQYPFDDLAEPTLDPATQQYSYASFHVALPEGKDPKKHMAGMSSNVNAANKRYQVEKKDENGNVVTEPVERRKLVKGDDGKPVLDGNGKKQYQKYTETAPVMENTRKFIIRYAAENDPAGPGLRVFRVNLDFAG